MSDLSSTVADRSFRSAETSCPSPSDPSGYGGAGTWSVTGDSFLAILDGTEERLPLMARVLADQRFTN